MKTEVKAWRQGRDGRDRCQQRTGRDDRLRTRSTAFQPLQQQFQVVMERETRLLS